MAKTRIMLYVDDVAANSQFWQSNLNAKLVSSNALPDGSQNEILAVSDEVEFSLFSKAFIKKYSPEVLGTTGPSLMIFRDDFEALHAKLKSAGDIADVGGQLTFNFQDPDGNYYVIAKADQK